MAIDDNTSYELTGAQVKDLAARIKSKATNTTFTWDSGSMYDVDYNAVTANVVVTAFLNGTVSVDDFDDGSVGKVVEYNSYGTYSDTHGTYHDVVAFTVDFTAQNGVVTRKQYLNEPNLAGWIEPRTISISSSTYSDFTGATSSTAGTHGLVPAPAAGDENKVLSGAGTWVAVSSGGSYSAGNGISIDANNEISIDTSVVAEVSDIPTNTSDLVNDGSDGTSTYVEADELATVATSGSYADLLNTPSIPAAQVNSDWNANSGVAEILNKPTLATVATSGSYNDLLNKPTIPAAQVNSDWNANSGVAKILNKPSLAAVATSGAYSDLTGTPTIPTVNDATLTITQNGTSAGTFTANASSNTTIALTDTTYSTMTGASSGTAGTSGLVPAPAAGDENKVLSGDGTWAAVTSDKIDWSTICYSNSHTETNGAFRIINKSTTRTINVGDNEFTVSISSQVPTGFVPIGIVGMDLSGSGYSRIIITRNYISGNTISCCFYQTYNSSQSIMIAWKILCIKSAN